MCKFYSTFWDEGLKTAAKGKTNVFILSDSNLPQEYFEQVVGSLSSQVQIYTYSLKGGEQIKTLEHAEKLYNELDKMGADRKTLFVCLGGGTISDLGGFVASTFKRGLGLVLLPTTVLAIVDAAIGGKNGVNFKSKAGLLKNQIGTYHSPEFIGYNPVWLESLPIREVRSGWAEMVKHGLIKREKGLLDKLYEVSSGGGIALLNIIPLLKSSAAVKEEIVVDDPTEQGGRVVLNLGHTVGHALESCGELRHGEAVAWGLVFMLETSKVKNGFSKSESKRLQDWITRVVEMPLPQVGSEELWGFMMKDKKNENGNVSDLLLHDSGNIDVNFIWKRDEFTALWEQFRSKFV
jgi:3-dehydroquinate synthase